MRSVVWIGWYRSGSFAPATRRYVRALQPYLKALKIAPLEALATTDEFFPLCGDVDDDDFTICNHLPHTDPEANGYLSVFEYDHIPEEWVHIFDQAQVVMTQSSFCRDIFAKQMADPSKIHVIPYILSQDFRNFDEKGPRFQEKSPNLFVFGSIFEWVARKAPERTIKAFLQEFSHVAANSEQPRAILLLRTTLPSPSDLKIALGQWYKPFIHAIQQKLIFIVDSFIPNLGDFYRSLDAYICCSAGEGWSQTLCEAMAAGLPTIGSKHSGNLDFMDDHSSYLVDVHDWSPGIMWDPTAHPNETFLWKLPKIDSIRRKMREVYEIWADGKEDPKIPHAIQLRSELTPEKVGQKIYKAIKEFL